MSREDMLARPIKKFRRRLPVQLWIYLRAEINQLLRALSLIVAMLVSRC